MTPINKWKGQYQFCIREYNLNKDCRYWYKAVDAERMLAGIVAEARAKKFRGLPIK